MGPVAAAEEVAVTIDRPEDAVRRDIGDALIGGEVGISREHADQLAPAPPDTGEAPVPPKAAAVAPEAPTPGPARTAGPGGW